MRTLADVAECMETLRLYGGVGFHIAEAVREDLADLAREREAIEKGWLAYDVGWLFPSQAGRGATRYCPVRIYGPTFEEAAAAYTAYHHVVVLNPLDIVTL